jgi:hypothetical protein
MTKKKPPLDLDKCLTDSIKDKTITKNDAEAILEYSMGLGESYWEMHWGDIEEQNGMSEKEAEAFTRFYNKYKKNEVVDGKYKHILFDCSIYS